MRKNEIPQNFTLSRNPSEFYVEPLFSTRFVSKLPIGYKTKQENFLVLLFLAEREGFEPPVPLSTSVFKTGAIDHSATSPKVFVSRNVVFPFLTLQKYIKKVNRARE